MGSREAAEFLHLHVASMGRDVAFEQRAGTIRYRRAGRVFAVVRVLVTRVDVGFHKFGRARSKRILHAKTGRLPFVPYRVELEEPGDVDSELLAWLKESYDLAAEPQGL